MPTTTLQSPEELSGFKMATDLSEQVAVSVEAYGLLGRISGDPEQFQETVRQAYEGTWSRAQEGLLLPDSVGPGPVDAIEGELYITPFLDADFSLEDMLMLTDAARSSVATMHHSSHPLNQDSSELHRKLWFSTGPNQEGYSSDEINVTNPVDDDLPTRRIQTSVVRIALKTRPYSQEPLLQFRGLPYDRVYADESEPTQLAELAKAQAEFVASDINQGLELAPISAPGFVMLALQARIKGDPLPCSWSNMRIPQLGRKIINGRSIVGTVSTQWGQVMLGASNGRGVDSFGIGLSLERSIA